MDGARVRQLIASFARQHILVVGDVVLDRYIHGKVERLNPEAPVPVLHAHRRVDMTGAAGNVAKNAAALGATVYLVGVVGADDTAEVIRSAIQAEGYQDFLVTDPGRPTIRKVRYLVNGQQLLRVDWEKTEDIDLHVAEQVNEQVSRAFEQSIEAVIVSDYAKGVVTQPVADHIKQLAKAHQVPLAADVKPSRINLFKGATFIAPNLKEAHEYLGLNHLERGGSSPAELARRLSEKFDTDVYLTLGPDGIYVYTKGGETSLHCGQEHRPQVADPSGAGDTAVVAMMLAYLGQAMPQEIAAIGNAAGAVVVSKVGSVGIGPQELTRMLVHEHEL